MRDTFYCWLYLALMCAIQFGGAVQRAVDGRIAWLDLIAFSTIGIAATMGVIDHYRKKK